jgi:hypothetical protein
VTVCRRCRQGWQEGGGAQVAIEPAAIDRAMCDAQRIGSIDSTVPERAIRTFRRAPRAWCGVAMGGAAACPAAGRREDWRSITWSIAPTAEAMRLRTSACCAARVTSLTIVVR